MRRQFLIGLTAVAATSIVPGVNATQSPRKLNWPDLLPESVKQLREQAYDVGRQLDAMSEEKRRPFDLVQEELDLRKRIELGFLAQDRLDEESKALLTNPPSKKYPEALAFWERIDGLEKQLQSQRHKPNTTLVGKAIRMPGYVLALEYIDDKVSEFLLVPYVGACIHAPTPAANQMVFVKAEQPFASEQAYKAVWVEGVLNSEQGTHKLSLVDGTADVAASYVIQAARVEPFKR